MLNGFCLSFFFNDPATTEIYTLSLHDALPIYADPLVGREAKRGIRLRSGAQERDRVRERLLSGHERSEEHTSELQSRLHLVCRLLLEKKKKKNNTSTQYILEDFVPHIISVPIA